MAASLMDKFANLLRELGFVGAFCYVVHRLGAKSGGVIALHRYLFVTQPVAGVPLLPARRGRSITVQQLDPQDPQLLNLPLDRTVLAYRAGQGAVCFGAFKEGEIIGCLWLCFEGYEEDEVRCRYLPQPADQTSWDFDVYLKPGHRSGLGFARLWDEANAFLRRHGIAYSWSRISAFNPGSLASHARLGAEIRGNATFLRLGPCQFMRASLPPRWHFSCRRSRRPFIELVNRRV